MKNHSITCPYCNAPAILRPASTVYRNSPSAFGRHLYVCTNWPQCDAYVSAHVKDKSPMGTPANGDLRHKRILAHQALDRYRKLVHMESRAAYIWLQTRLGKSQEERHIGTFTEEMCDEVITLCNNASRTYLASQKNTLK